MTHVVTEPCIRCKYTDCVEVCPVDAFREGRNMLVIDPDECIDCRVCIPECPVGAIFADAEVPTEQQPYLETNADLARRWPVITRKRPLADGDDWAQVRDKTKLLDPRSARDAS